MFIKISWRWQVAVAAFFTFFAWLITCLPGMWGRIPFNYLKETWSVEQKINLSDIKGQSWFSGVINEWEKLQNVIR